MSEVAARSAEISWRPARGKVLRAIRVWRRRPLGLLGAGILLVLLLCAAFAPAIAPAGYAQTVIRDRLQGPTVAHWFGTDEVGHDLLSLIIYGARVSVVVGISSVMIAQVIALFVGVASAYWGGWLDLLLQRFVDVWQSLPALVLLISVIAIFGTGEKQVILAMGLVLSAGSSRVVRSAAFGVAEMPYIEAARSVGASDVRIIRRHIVPNVLVIVIILFTVQVGGAILLEASLSFLGYGVPPPQPSWGRMLSASGLQYARHDPWIAIWPGLAISLVVFGVNMFGDALRDVLDPRLR